MELVFQVIGVGQPQGSARAFTYQRSAEKGGGIGARVDTDNTKLKAWRRDVARAAARALVVSGVSFIAADHTVRVCADFYLPRPKKYGAKAIGHTKRPDVDKLARGLLDALTGIVWVDDAQVSQLKVTKAYARVGEEPHAVVAVSTLAVEGRLL